MKSCSEYALEYIHRFPKSKKELQTQLIKKWYNLEDVIYTIWKIEEMGYVDDEMYTKLYLRSECINKWKSITIVRSKLLSKWVEKDIIDKVVKNLEEEIHNGMDDKLQKEIRKMLDKWLDNIEIYQKLSRRWYSFDDIKNNLKSIINSINNDI